jgi:hypothetical protein
MLRTVNKPPKTAATLLRQKKECAMRIPPKLRTLDDGIEKWFGIARPESYGLPNHQVNEEKSVNGSFEFALQFELRFERQLL